MKKLLVILLLLAAICIGGFFGYQKLTERKIASLESIISDQALYYLYWGNPNKKIRDFQESGLFKEIVFSSAYQKFIKPLIEKQKKNIAVIADMFEEEAAFAMFSVSDNLASSEAGINDLGKSILLLRMSPKKHPRIKKAIADFYLFSSDSERYKGIKITTYDLPDVNGAISYTLLSDVVIFSNDPESIKKSIDLFKGQADNSLSNNDDFQKAAARIKRDSLIWGYQNNRKYYQEILRKYTQSSLQSKGLKGVSAVQSLTKMKPFMNLANVFKNTVFDVSYDQSKSGMVITSYYSFDKERDEDGFLKIIVNKDKDENILSLIPKDIIGYYCGSQNFLGSWSFVKKIITSFVEMMKAEASSDYRRGQLADKIDAFNLDSALKSVESFLGINIETEIFPLIGDDSGAVLVDIRDVYMVNPWAGREAVAFPDFYFFFELKDSSKVSQAMNKAINGLVDNVNKVIQAQQEQAKLKMQSVPAQEEGAGLPQEQGVNPGSETQPRPTEEEKALKVKIDSYKGFEIVNIDVKDSPVDFLRANYCVLDKYIVFSLSQDVTKKVIDVYKDKKNSFASNPDFEFIQEKMLPKYSAGIFFDFRKLVKDISSTISFSRVKSGLPSVDGEKFSLEDLSAIMEILEKFSILSFSCSLIEPDVMRASVYLKVEGL